MPLSAVDLALLRGKDHIVRPKLNIYPKTTVATATVFETPTLYPIGSVEVSNLAGWASVRPGMMFEIKETTGESVTYGVVRKFPSIEQLYIDGKSRGDAGKANTLLRAIAAGQNISIYNYYPLWSMLSRINQGVFYKKFDIAYVDEGRNPNPVCNLGKWRRVDASSTGYGRVSFDNDNSFAWLDRQVLGFLWEIPNTANVVSGSITSNRITLDLPPGFHLIRCTITDNFGKTQTGIRPVWVNHPTEYPAISDQYAIQIEGDSQTMEGRTMSFRIYGDVDESLFMPGGAVLFTCDSLYEGGGRLTSNVDVDTYVGFITQDSLKIDYINGEKSIGFETKGPYPRFQDLPMVSQAIIEKSSPANWTEISIGLGHPDFIAWYILKHHTTYMELFDFNPLLEQTPVKKRNWGLNGGTVAEYVVQSGSSVAGYTGTKSDGTLTIRRDPNIEELDYRDSIDERMTITVDDLTDPPEIPVTFLPTVGQLKSFAFAYDGSDNPVAVASIAPGFVQGQAPGKNDEQTVLVGAPGTAQDKSNRIAGHLYAKRNNPTPEIQLKLARNIDIADPADVKWFRLVVPAKYNPRGVDIDTRVLVKSVDRGWENVNGVWLKRMSWTVEPETFGQPGETYIVDTGGGSVYPPFQPPGEEGGNWLDEGSLDFKRNFKFVVAWDSVGQVGITFNGENWKTVLGIEVNGVPSDLAPHWDSPYIKNGFTTGAMKTWMVSVNGAFVYVYFTENITDNKAVIWTRKLTILGDADGGIKGTARVLTYKGDPNYVLVAWHDRRGTKIVWSTNAGTTWSSNTGTIVQGVGSAFDPDNDFIPLGADLDNDGTLVISGISSTSPVKYKLFRVPKASSSVFVVANSPESNSPFPTVKLSRTGGGGYCSVGNNTVTLNPTGEINWDTNFQINGATTIIDGTSTRQQLHNSSYFVQSNLIGPLTQSGTYEMKPVVYDTTLSGLWNVTAIYGNVAWYYDFPIYTAPDDPRYVPLDPRNYSSDFAYKYVYINITCYGVNDNVVLEWSGNILASLGAVPYFNVPGGPFPDPIYRIRLKVGFIGDAYSIPKDATGSWYCQIGSYNIGFAGTKKTTFTHKLYRFSNYASPSAAFTDVSPDAVWAPVYAYGVAVDRVDPRFVATMATTDNFSDQALFISTDRGDTWEPLGFGNYQGLQKMGDYAVLHGLDMDVSVDNGESFSSIIGDWDDVMPQKIVATFRGVMASSLLA